MTSKRIYLGPNDGRQPVTVRAKTVAGGYLPGTFVTEGATTLTQATAFGPNLRLLSDRDYYAEPSQWFSQADALLTPYTSGDTGIAYVMEPAQHYQGAAAAATYTFGQELTVGAAGRLVAAASGDVVVGHAREAGFRSAGAMLAFEVAIYYTKP